MLGRRFDPEKKAALEKAVASIRDRSGKGSVHWLEKDPIDPVTAVPTGCPAFDRALGVGGWPRSRMTELFGGESCGKTTLALTSAAYTQQLKGIAGIVDVENAFDPDYATTLGVNVKDLVIAQPGTAEEAIATIADLVRSKALDLLIVDSVAGFVTEEELEGKLSKEEAKTAVARFMSRELRKLIPELADSPTALVFLNQVRTQLKPFGHSSEETPAGRALKFFASVRAKLQAVAEIKNPDKTPRGSRIRMTVIKSKVAMPFQTGETDLILGRGFSVLGTIFDFGVEYGIITQKGSWFSFQGEGLGQGRDAVIATLQKDSTLRSTIEDAIVRASRKSS